MAMPLFAPHDIHRVKTNQTIHQNVVANYRSSLLSYYMWLLNDPIKWFAVDSYCNLFNTFKPVITRQFLMISFGVFVVFTQSFNVCAQKDVDERTQYPGILSNSFIG